MTRPAAFPSSDAPTTHAIPSTDLPATPRVAVIGFGYVGACLGVVLAEAGIPVTGIDVDTGLIGQLRAGRCPIPEPGLPEAIARLAGSPMLTYSSDLAAAESADVVLITVGTPVDEHGAMDPRALRAACQGLAPRLRRGQLVVLKSTVTPGTTRGVVGPLLEEGGLEAETDFGLAFCPERLAEGTALAQLRSLPVIVGGTGPRGTAGAQRFWSDAVGLPVRVLPDAESAEIVKLATNWWIDANIAIANEVAQVCSAFAVDVLDVVATANELPKGASHVNILQPSIGVGGSCLPKDPWMVWRAARDRGIELRTVSAAREVNDRMPALTATTIVEELLKSSVDPAEATIAVLGVAFKSDTGDLRHTPVAGVVEGLRASGAEVRLFDPLADAELVAAEFGILPVSSLADAVDGAHCVAVLAGHREFRDLDLAALRTAVAPTCLLFDGRAYYPRATIEQARDLGFRYRGIGR